MPNAARHFRRRPAALSERLSRALVKAGALRIGFADLTQVRERPVPRLRVGISILIPFADLSIAGKPGQPLADPAYIEAYMRSRLAVDRLTGLGVGLLRAAGFEAWGYGYEININRRGGDMNPLARLTACYQQKTTARLAGLGWIGRMGVLVTNDFGPHVWLGTIFTNAPLPLAKPTEKSGCGSCRRCREVCPAGAVTGTLWRPGSTRADLLNIDKCQAHRRERGKKQPAPMCGLCLAACPKGMKFLKSRQ